MIPVLPHELWPISTIEDRVCGNCKDVHDFDQHVARGDRLPCGEKGCKCRDFACQEHPNGECLPDD